MELLCTKNCDHIVGNPPISFTIATCPRCLGKGTYHDISYSTSGKLNTINRVYQLNQQIEKILIENRRNSGYGFDYTLLQGVIDNNRVLAIQREVSRVINYFINNVQQTEKSKGYSYNSTEEVVNIDYIKVYQDSVEPRKIIILLSLITVSGQLRSIRVPLRR
jgi:hypothetical protein